MYGALFFKLKRLAGTFNLSCRPSPSESQVKETMRLVLAALTRPLAVIVALIAILAGFIMSLGRMRTDIFPQVGNPVIYVAQPYGGMTPGISNRFITRFHPRSVTMGLLLCTRPTHTQGELQNFALNQVRPIFST